MRARMPRKRITPGVRDSGTPFVSQRRSARAHRALRTHPELSGRRVAGRAGQLTVVALCAAALTNNQRTYLAGGLVSFRSIVETEIYRRPFANFVPNLLRHTDLPEIAARIAPRRVTLAGTVNAAGDMLAAAAVKNAYGSAGNVIARDQANWDVASLSNWAV